MPRAPEPLDLAEMARAILAHARADLGPNLGGYSPVDLLLDQIPGLGDSADARQVLAKIGEG